MFEVHPSNWPVAVDVTDPRNRFHATALHEARIASEYRGFAPEAPVRKGIVTRLRLAIAGGHTAATVEPCGCPA